MKSLSRSLLILIAGGIVLGTFAAPGIASEPTMLVGHRTAVVDVQFSADGKLLASITADGETIVWDLAAGSARRGPKVERSFGVGAVWLEYTRENPPMLMAGCDMHGFVVDPRSLKTISEWKDPKTTKGHYPLLYVGGRRFVKRTEVLQADRPEALFTVGFREPPLAAVSPNGKKWFTNRNMAVGNNSQVQVLDAASGVVLCDLKAFTSTVRGIAWAGNDRVLTLIDGGSYGGSLMLWDVSGTGKLLAKVEVPGAWRLAASADGQAAAVALKDNKVALIRIGAKQLRIESQVNAGLWGDNDPTFSMSQDGTKLLAASPSDNRWQLCVFDTKTGRELLVQKRKHDDALPELSPDGNWVAIGHASGMVSLAPVGTGSAAQPGASPLAQILDRPLDHPAAPGMPDGIRNLYRPYRDGRIVVSQDGERMVVATRRADVIASVADAKEGAKHLPVWQATSSRPSAKELPTWALLPDKTVLVEGTSVGLEKLPNFVSGRVNPATGQFQVQPQKRSLQFTAIQPSPDGKAMAVRACEWTLENDQRRRLPGSLMLLDMQTGKTLRTLATGLESDAPSSMVFSDSGERLAVLENWKLRVFETASGEELPLAGEWKSERFWFVDDGKILARQESNGSIVGIDLDTQAEAFRWRPSDGQAGQVTAVEISLNGKLAAVGGSTGDLTLRNPRTGAILHRLKPMERPIGGLGFSPDGSVLAAADEERRLIVWKIGSLEANAGDKPATGSREIRVGDL